eukprot:jgi/Ulvmu1/4796/UM020_0081.1
MVTDSTTGRHKALFWSDDFSGSLLNVTSSVPLKLRSDQVVSGLFPHPSSSSKHDFIAVLADCTVMVLDSSAGSMSKLFGHVGSTTLHACVDGKTLYVMAKTMPAAGNGKAAKQQKSFVLIGLPFDSSSSEDVWTAHVKPPQNATELQSFVVSGITLTCVWVDGSITILSVSPARGVRQQHTLDIPAARTTPADMASSSKKRRTHNAPNGVSPSISSGRCHVTALHEHSVILFASSGDARETRFVVINTLFGAPVSTGLVDANVVRKSQHSRLVAAARPPNASQDSGNSVFLAFDGRVVRTSIPAPEAALAGAVGCLAPARGDAQSAVLSAECIIHQQTAGAPQALRRVGTDACSAARSRGEQSRPPSQTNFLVKAQSTWERNTSVEHPDLIGTLQKVALATGPVDNESEVQELINALGPSRMVLTGDLLEKLAGRLQESKQWTLLEQLVRRRPLRSLPLCPCILSTCAEEGQLRILSCLLREASDVALPDFIAMLRELTTEVATGQVDRQALQQASAAMQTYAYGVARRLCIHAEDKKRSLQGSQAAAAAVAAVDGFSGMQIVMHAAIACRLDVHEILDACRSLDSIGTEHLLAYLQIWLERMLGDGSRAWFNEVLWHGDLCVPSLKQILLWCQAAIDAQAINAGAALRTKPRLQALARLLSAASVVCQEVATLTGMIKQLQTLPAELSCTKQESGWTIDVLDLHVDRRL